jgi:hypothetical protein
LQRLAGMRSLVVYLVLCGFVSGCGYSHINRDSSSRPERSTGSAARVLMPGEAAPPSEAPAPELETTMIGGSTQESDQSQRTRDVPLGPLFTIFGYPFWIFWIL